MNYNNIAHRYDTLYEWWDFQSEDITFGNVIWNVKWSIVDLGCGTGQWIKILNPVAWQYVWIDPSEKMLTIAHNKYPKHTFIHWNIHSCPITMSPSIITWLFWVMNYLTNDEIETTLRVWKSVFLMDYVDWYHPINYSDWETPRRNFSRLSFGQLFRWSLFGNYNIYTNRTLPRD